MHGGVALEMEDAELREVLPLFRRGVAAESFQGLDRQLETARDRAGRPAAALAPPVSAPEAGVEPPVMEPQRDSTKHSPRVDEELKKEVSSLVHGAPTESRREEWREQEGAADGEPEPSARVAAPGRLGPDNEAARAELSRHLRLSAFPGDREALLREAEANNAPEAVFAALRHLPEGRQFSTVYDVWGALGGEIEHVAGRPDRHGGGDRR